MAGDEQVRVDDELAELLGQGVAVVMATRDAEMRPEIARCWGVQIAEHRAALTLCVEAGDASRIRANVVSGTLVAIACTRPSTYRSVQFKGQVTAVAEPTPEQIRRAERHRDAFVLEAAEVGVPLHLGPYYYEGSALLAVTVAVHATYDQTPGPDAGERR